ncbi:AAA family ATPase [Bacteriovoracales bacterium]|nr:AAA family ATPase [Bacteriovoracales bacterium]
MYQNHSPESFSGIVERVTFHNEQNGWSVLKVAPFSSQKELVTVIIHQVKVFAGASLQFFGSWTHHKKFGEQFNAEKIIEKKPASTAAIEKYLGSGLIKGVGPKTAQRIVKHFGNQTLSVFEGNIEDLMNVPGIAKGKLATIKQSWQDHRAIRDVMLFLQNYGISTLFAVKIYKTYGEDSIKKVSENPYCLAKDIYGIGFFSADKIALKMGLSPEGFQRIQAGVKFVLNNARESGHCYLTKDQILGETQEILQLAAQDLIEKEIDNLIKENEIALRKIPDEKTGVKLYCYYARSLFFEENLIVKKVALHTQGKRELEMEKAKDWVKSYCSYQQFSLSEEQEESVYGVIQRPFSILTGGPGCGKTTTTNVIVHLLMAMNKKIILAAPTGRAAQRMGEVIGIEAKTIHRLLAFSPEKFGFKKDEKDPLEGDFIIIDETSMLDVSLAAALFKAVPENMQILFIGDPDQLPSVGAGNVLHDLLKSPFVSKFQLTQVFRQAKESYIVRYAHQINQGLLPKIDTPIEKPDLWKSKTDCLFIDSEEATKEQLNFIARAKKTVKKIIETNTSSLITSEDKTIGILSKKNNEQVVLKNVEEVSDFSSFQIPKKFLHINFNHLINSESEVDELRNILKKIPPHSSLNYGLTALDTIKRLYTKTLPNILGPQTEIQILSPQVRGSLGTANLNQVIQETVNPSTQGKNDIQIGGKTFREDDRVIQTKNNYELGVFNGDIGKILNIDSQEGQCLVLFKSGKTEREVLYEKGDIAQLTLAYAITVHKSQGSEFEAVIIPVSTQHFKMLFRNLIYTGLTRAKKRLVFVGSRKALAMAAKKVDSSKRQTALTYLVNQKLEGYSEEEEKSLYLSKL